MRAAYPILVVANCEVPELDDLGLDRAGPVVFAGEAHALALIAERPLGGLVLVVDGPGPLRGSRTLLDEYLRGQPMGRIAILSMGCGDATAARFAMLPSRVEVFFAPWSGDEVLAFLNVAAAAPASA